MVAEQFWCEAMNILLLTSVGAAELSVCGSARLADVFSSPVNRTSRALHFALYRERLYRRIAAQLLRVRAVCVQVFWRVVFADVAHIHLRVVADRS